MASDAPTSDREPKLLTIRLIALGGVELEASLAQPINGQVFKDMTGSKNTQGLPIKIPTIVLRGLGVFELQSPFTGNAKTGTSEILAWCLALVFGNQSLIDMSVHLIGECLGGIVVQHQKGTSVSSPLAIDSMAS